MHKIIGANVEKYKLSRAYLDYINPKKNLSTIVNRKMKTGEHDLDIIIPCYNVEKYVQRCVDSILRQDYKSKVRIILVDDGSKDATGKIIDEYSVNDKVLIIHQENKGLSGSRNTGLLKVNSDYLMFLDSDDYLIDGNLDAMIDFAHNRNADIIEGKIISFAGDYADNYKVTSDEFTEINRMKATGYACGKLIRTSLFDNIALPEGYWFEDGIISYLILPKL